MTYKPHIWTNGEMITAEKMNDLEEAAAQAAQPGPPGEKGEPGEGLTGTAPELAELSSDAKLADVVAKANEISRILIDRGIAVSPKV